MTLADQAETGSPRLHDGATHLLVLPGDGIGPEIVGATVDVLREADRIFGLDLTLQTAAIGFDSLKTAGTTITDEVVAQAKRAAGVILGPRRSPRAGSTRPASCANGSTCSPISGRRARGPD